MVKHIISSRYSGLWSLTGPLFVVAATMVAPMPAMAHVAHVAHNVTEFVTAGTATSGILPGLGHLFSSWDHLKDVLIISLVLLHVAIGIMAINKIKTMTSYTFMISRKISGMIFRTEHFWRISVLFVVAAMVTPIPAMAHHMIEFAMPDSAATGILSGLGHLFLGWDHLLFLVGFSLLSWHLTGRKVLLSCLVIAMLFGVHMANGLASGLMAAMPQFYLGLIALLGLMLLVQHRIGFGRLGFPVAALFGIVAGFSQGYLLSEGIIGAEPTPLVAYLVGLGLAHVVWMVLCWIIWRVVFPGLTRLPSAQFKVRAIYMGTAAVLALVAVTDLF